MDFELSDDQQRIRAVAREFADAELGDKIAPYDARHEFAWEIVKKLGPLGFLGVLVPEDYGGAGPDYTSASPRWPRLEPGAPPGGHTPRGPTSLCPPPRSPLLSPRPKHAQL